MSRIATVQLFRTTNFIAFITLSCFGARCLAGESEPELIAKFEFDREAEPARYQFREITASGDLRMRPVAAQRNGADAKPMQVSAGYYLGIVLQQHRKPDGALATPIRVDAVDGQGRANARLKPAAAKRLAGGQYAYVVLVQPQDVKPEQLQALPDLMPVMRGKPPIASDSGADDLMMERMLAQSSNNLKQLALGFHNYQAVHSTFPPAVIIGPDGKPWHSWRVLLLPWLELSLGGQELYEQYRFDEPWDGPNNKRLLNRMPAFYADPIYGEGNRRYTNYAAITGPGTMFSTEGAKLVDGEPMFGGGVSERQVSDNVANTLMLGPVATEAKIPWTKPQDIPLANPFPALGAKGSFALPYEANQTKFGPFLMGDGMVVRLTQFTRHELLQSLFTIAGGEVIDRSDLLTPSGPMSRAAPAIYIVRQGGQITAWIE